MSEQEITYHKKTIELATREGKSLVKGLIASNGLAIHHPLDSAYGFTITQVCTGLQLFWVEKLAEAKAKVAQLSDVADWHQTLDKQAILALRDPIKRIRDSKPELETTQEEIQQ